MDGTASATTVQLGLLMDGWNYVGKKKRLLALVCLHVNSASGCVDGTKCFFAVCKVGLN